MSLKWKKNQSWIITVWSERKTLLQNKSRIRHEGFRQSVRGSGRCYSICLKSKPQLSQPACVQLWLAFHPTASPNGTCSTAALTQQSCTVFIKHSEHDSCPYWVICLILCLFFWAQMICRTWSVPCILSWNSPLWPMVSHHTQKSTKLTFSFVGLWRVSLLSASSRL